MVKWGNGGMQKKEEEAFPETIPHGGMGEWGNATWPKKSFPKLMEYGKDRHKQDLKNEGWTEA